jgi:FAD/FMN-containing dehydrogenase/Fe-S oxidoreductase
VPTTSPALTPDRIAAELRLAGVGEVDVAARRRAEYSSDASLYRVVPTAVAFPRSPDDIVRLLQRCRALGVPVTMRGAGTSIAGNAVGTGVVVDCSRHLRAIGSVDAEQQTVDVQPGVVLDDLQRAIAVHGLRFGPDPSTHSRATLGGMIGNNACGSRAQLYGRTADNVEALDIVTGTGERLAVGRTTPSAPSATLTALKDAVAADLAVIRTEFGRFKRQISGYSLEHLLPENGFDVAKALVGSEGTLALTLGATLRLVRTPPASTLVVLGYPDIATAADDAPALLPLRPVAIEGVDARIIELVKRVRGAAAAPSMPAGAAWLFVELAAADAAELPAATAALAAAASPLDWREITDPREVRELWSIREDGAGLVGRPTANGMGLSGWEDAAVPPESLGSYLREFEQLVDRYHLIGYPYGHFGDGCVHVRLDFSLRGSAGREAFRDFLLEAAQLAAAHGGSMSGEHGDGRARSELLPLMYSPAALQTISRVKEIFDPSDILNPGIVVKPAALDADLRLAALPSITTDLAFGYHDDAGDFARAVHRCTGVGKCRADNTATGGVMCPSYLATRDEKDTTRGRARVLQEMAAGKLSKGWRSPELLDALDLCLSCKGCSTDCPTGTDMATYKAEVLYQRYRHRLRPMSHYSLGRLPSLARVVSKAPKLVNAVMASRLGRIGARLGGVDKSRELPRFATRTFSDWFATHPVAPGDPLLLWIDTFTEHFSPDVGIAAVAVLERAGFSIQVATESPCCGLTLISTGQLDAARRTLRRSLAAIAPFAAAGMDVVVLEPSCAAVFRGDAAHLLDAAEAALGARVRTLAEALSARPGWTPPDLTGSTILAQPHCHQHAVMGWETDQALLTLAGATVQRLGGCCGLAGNFGAERGHFDVSVAVAETALLPAVRAMPAGSTLLADGFSCRTQLDQLAPGWVGGHLAELLAARLATPGSST